MKHAAKVRLTGLVVLGLGLGFATHSDSLRRTSAEESARSAESPVEPFRGTASRKQGSSTLLVSRLQPPANGQTSFSVEGESPVQKGTAQESAGVPFENFRIILEPEDDEIDVKGSFTLGAASNGIDLFKEKSALKVGTFSATIPAGSFKQGPKNKAEFKKLIECKYWDLFIRSMGKNTFEFHLELQGGRGEAKIKAEDVVLSIGDDSGRAKPAS
jgi:hypothetical protein